MFARGVVRPLANLPSMLNMCVSEAIKFFSYVLFFIQFWKKNQT